MENNNLDSSKHIPFLQGLENDTKEYGIADGSNANVGLLDFDLGLLECNETKFKKEKKKI